jgi:hypothetical protein
VARATIDLRDAPAAPAGAVYAGVLDEALGLADLDVAARPLVDRPRVGAAGAGARR